MMTIVLADDHHVVRKGLRALLEAEVDFSVIGEAADGLAVVGLVERLKPQVLIVDLMMPGLNGLEVVRQVKQRVAPTQIIVLSMHANEAYVLEALRNGAAGYVLKDASPTEFMCAVREVAAGRHYLSSALSERAIEAYIQKATISSSDQYETLTTREREVLHLVAQGAKNSDIAARLSISVRTAETHRTNLMRKLSLHNQADLRQYALQRGLIPLWE
jgi:DNA-binding NarL/FixJ family response regulator